MARTVKVVEDRREQIIDAAMRVFAQKGFARATNKDIAREAGITPGLIYHYFANKDDLLKTVIESRTPLRLLREIPNQAMELPPEQLLRFLIGQVLAILEGEQFMSLIRVVLSELLHGEEKQLALVATGAIQRALGLLGSYLEAKMNEGVLRHADAALMAQVMMGSVVGFVLRRQILSDVVALQYTHEQIVDSIVDVVLDGLLPR